MIFLATPAPLDGIDPGTGLALTVLLGLGVAGLQFLASRKIDATDAKLTKHEERLSALEVDVGVLNERTNNGDRRQHKRDQP